MKDTAFLKVQNDLQIVQMRPLSTLLTTVIAAKLVWPHITEPTGQTLKIAFLGAREHIEGVIDTVNLRSMLQKHCGWKGSRLQLDLIGPEMDRTTLSSTPGVNIRCINGLYHKTKPQPVHFALALNAGIDNSFASWTPTILYLRDRRTPTIFTGYKLDKVGCERMLRSFKINIVAPTRANPFRLIGPLSAHCGYPDEFLVAMCGCEVNVPHLSLDLKELHRQERIAKLEELAVLNEDDGLMGVAKRLRQLRRKLVAKEIVIPEEVQHNVLEGWAMGRDPPAW